METNEKIERLLADIRLKADQFIVDDEEARHAGVSDGSLPSLDSDEGLQKEDITQTEAWRQVKAQARLDFETTVLEQRKKYFQTLLRHSLINEWIEENVGLKGGIDLHQLRSTIESYIATDRIPALKLYLSDVLAHGMKIADKNGKRRKTGGWAWLGYSFAVVKGLIYIAAVLAIFSVAESQFEKVVLVILLLIGNAATNNASGARMVYVNVGETLDNQFNQLRRFFRLPEEEFERDARQEARAKTDIQISRETINFLIENIFGSIIWLICAVELVMVLLR
jgi:hypothetical protein